MTANYNTATADITGRTGYPTEIIGNDPTAVVGFYGSAGTAQPTTTSDVVTALQALGLLAAGTYQITGKLTVSTNETGTTVSALSGTGWSSVNATTAKTFILSPPTAGVEKVLYNDSASTAVITIQANSTTVSASAVSVRALNQVGTSLVNIVFTNSSLIGGGMSVTLLGISSTEWMVKSQNSTAVTLS